MEIIFVSSDKSEAEMMQYMEEVKMPWLAVPIRSEAATALKQINREELGVKGIPALVILRDGQILTKEGRKDVQ